MRAAVTRFRKDCLPAAGRLDEYLVQHGVIGIRGIDTRALVRRIREQGAMRGVLSTTDLADESGLAAVRERLRGLNESVRPVVADHGRIAHFWMQR